MRNTYEESESSFPRFIAGQTSPWVLLRCARALGHAGFPYDYCQKTLISSLYAVTSASSHIRAICLWQLARWHIVVTLKECCLGYDIPQSSPLQYSGLPTIPKWDLRSTTQGCLNIFEIIIYIKHLTIQLVSSSTVPFIITLIWS